MQICEKVSMAWQLVTQGQLVLTHTTMCVESNAHTHIYIYILYIYIYLYIHIVELFRHPRLLPVLVPLWFGSREYKHCVAHGILHGSGANGNRVLKVTYL